MTPSMGPAGAVADMGRRGCGLRSHTGALLPWQARFLKALGRDGVRTAALSIARSNGKSWLAAVLAVEHLLGEGERDAEAVVVASSYQQAKVVYRYALRMLREAGHDIDDRGSWALRDSWLVGLVRRRSTGRAIRALGSDPRRAHGRIVGLAILDEPAQWPPGTSDEMLSAIRTGLGKVVGSRMIAIGTRPASPAHWFSEWLAGGCDHSQVHAAREGDPPFWKRTLKRANPSYDHLPALREDLASQAREAKADPMALARYRALALNMGVEDVAARLLLDAATWERIEGEAPATGATVWGVDLSSGVAMAAVACHWPSTGRLDGFGAFSADPDLATRSRRDGAGQAYWRAAHEGRLLQLGRRTIPIPELLREALGRWGAPVAVVGDRWRVRELADALDEVLPGVQWVPRGQGYRDAGEDVREFRRACLEDRVTPVRSVLMRHCLSVTRLVSDPAGNEKLARKSEGGRRQLARDDLAAAAVLAVAEGSRRRASLSRPAWRSLGVVG